MDGLAFLGDCVHCIMDACIAVYSVNGLYLYIGFVVKTERDRERKVREREKKR